MARKTLEATHPEELEKDERPRSRNPARVAGLLVLLAGAISLVVQNGQGVAVHFWFATGHIRLLWLVVISLAVGAAGEAVVRRAVRLRIRGRRQRDR